MTLKKEEHPRPFEHPLELVELDVNIGPQINHSYSIILDSHGVPISSLKPGRIEKREDRECLVGGYFLFDINDKEIFNIDETVTLELTFDRRDTNGFTINYDGAVNSAFKTVKFDAASASNRWHTERVSIERARFANRKYEHTDFGIASLGSSIFPPIDSDMQITLCGVTITTDKSNRADPTKKGQLQLTVKDERGSLTAARVGIYADDGKAPLAGEQALRIPRWSDADTVRDLPLSFIPKAWSEKGRFVFYVDGRYDATMPEGEYTAYVIKGPEYRILSKKFQISKGQPVKLDIAMQRWQDMPSQGWYSGDAHIHLGRHSSDENAALMTFMQAEDLHLANLLEMGNLGGSAFQQYVFGEKGRYQSGYYSLVPGQEAPRTTHRGHTIGLNGKRFYWPERDYYNFDLTSDAIHADGGIWGYAHVIFNAFDLEYGVALDVPRNKVDFFEIFQDGYFGTEYLYDFLNLGFKLTPVAGSDYPYIRLPGAERAYVKTGEPGVDNWFRQLLQGRSFVTNGPVIQFSVNGDSSQKEYHIKPGEKLTINANASVNPDYDEINIIELVAHGKVLESVSNDSGNELIKLSAQIQAKESMWIALRTYGKGNTMAHTAPIYVYVGDDRDFGDESQQAALSDKYIKVLESFREVKPDIDEESERLTIQGHMMKKWSSSNKALQEQINDSIEIYRRIKASSIK